jgi:predicted Fe-Mo cluster-binding NifX family protein
MRIAIARTGNEVSQHFGYCDNFLLYDLDGDKIVKENILANPGHQPGFLPRLLRENGVELVISGGMGSKAKELFQANNIQTITGVSGTADQILQAFLENTLVGTGETCNHEHKHDHDGNHEHS